MIFQQSSMAHILVWYYVLQKLRALHGKISAHLNIAGMNWTEFQPELKFSHVMSPELANLLETKIVKLIVKEFCSIICLIHIHFPFSEKRFFWKTEEPSLWISSDLTILKMRMKLIKIVIKQRKINQSYSYYQGQQVCDWSTFSIYFRQCNWLKRPW